MPYIGATELSLILPANVSIGTNTVPITLDEVGSMIAEVTGRLDGALAGAGYGVPIPTTATDAYTTVQSIVKDGVGCRVMRTLFPNIGQPKDKIALAADYCEAYKQAMADIKDGSLVLVGAPKSTDESARSLPRSYSTTSGATGAETGASAYITRTWEP